jgi:hypothetical protein
MPIPLANLFERTAQIAIPLQRIHGQVKMGVEE